MEKKINSRVYYDRTSTTDFTAKLDYLVEQTKLNEIFRGDYMAWGLAEFDAERRGYKDGIVQGSLQKAIETAKNLFLKNIPIDIIAECTGISMEEISELTKHK